MSTNLNLQVQGPRVVPRPRTMATAASQYSGIYMRPNLSNGNAIPAGGSLCECPDIWPAGTTPVGNFQTALATSDSYATQSPSDITLQETNYIYVRGFNASANTASVSVSLYYAPSALLQHPSYWENNPLQTDQGSTAANITNLAPQTVGVADQTFVWPNVQSPPNGSDHYCLIAQFNDANNDNPIPDPSTQFDLATLIATNLGWGWHNISLVPAPAGINFTFSTGITVPSTYAEAWYSIIVAPVGYTGWSISYTCSQADANGNAIVLTESLITQNGGQLGGAPALLSPGFNALLTVTMYNPNNVTAQSGANVPINMTYHAPSMEEYELAKELDLIDWPATEYVRKYYPEGQHISQDRVTPVAVLSLGSVTGTNPNA